MIGIVLCGHGNFATGLYSSLKLIAGEQEKFTAIDFIEGMGSEELGKLLEEKVKEVDAGSGVVVFTDIPGGTPFNQGALISSKNESVKIIAGTNLPSLLDSSFKRQLLLESFIKEVVETGKDGFKTFELKIKKQDSEDLDEI